MTCNYSALMPPNIQIFVWFCGLDNHFKIFILFLRSFIITGAEHQDKMIISTEQLKTNM